ncbi:MAG TPA: arginine decarboxylase, partial [Cobetia sp.]|nr:arginine decarboxylase [Cobetia sp.]
MSHKPDADSAVQRARRTWNIDQWGSGYFDVDEDGQALVRPLGEVEPGPSLPLRGLVDQIRQAGLRLPVLIRFTDILHDRVEQLCAAFDQAMGEENFESG